MTIARVGTGAALVSVQNTTQAVVTYTPGGSGRLLVVQGGALYTGTDGTLTVTDNLGSTWSVILKRSTAAQQSYAYLAYLENCPAGITSVTVSFNQSAVYGHAKLDEWTGVATVSPLNAQQLDIATPAPKNSLTTGNLSPTDPNCLIYGVAEAEYSGGINAPWTTTLGSFTELDQYGDSFNNIFTQGIFQIATTTGPFSITWVPSSFADGEMMSILAAFAPPAAGTTMTPGAGALTLAGQAPTVVRTANVTVAPGAGALTLVAGEPQIPKHLTTPGDRGDLSYLGGESLVGGLEPPQNTQPQPGIGTLVLAGQAPTVVATSGGNVTVTPSAGALTLAGQAPTVLASITVSPGAGALTLAGQAPTVLSSLAVTPGAGALTLAGQAPSLLQNIFRAPAAGTLTLAGQAPTIVQDNVRAPSAGTLTLAGQAPTVLQDNVRAPGAGALTLAGQAPTVLQALIAQPGAGALVLAGQAPVLLQGNIRAPAAGALTLAGQAPTLLQNVIVQPGAGALTLAGQSPAVLNGDSKVAQPAAGALALAGQAPTVLASISVAPGAGALTLAGQAPTVLASQAAQPGAGALALAGQAPTLSVTVNVVSNPLTGALIITGLAPTVAVSDNQTVSPGAGALVLEGQAPTIPIPSPVVTPDPGALLLEGLAPGIVVSGDDGLLSAKYIARRPNVRVKGLQPEPQPAVAPLAPEITNMPGTEEVVRKAQGLNLGLITAPPAAPVPPAAAPVVEVPSIGVTVPAGPPPVTPEPAPAPAVLEPVAPPAPATQDDVAALHKAILEATKVEVGAQADRVLLVLASVLEKVDDLQAKIEADAKARDLRERNIQRAKQITERMLRDLEK